MTSLGADVIVSIVGFVFTIGTAVFAIIRTHTKLETKFEMKLEQLADVIAKKDSECEKWRAACMDRRKDEHSCLKDDFKDLRNEMRVLGQAVAMQTAELGRTNQQLIDLLTLWKNGSNGHK